MSSKQPIVREYNGFDSRPSRTAELVVDGVRMRGVMWPDTNFSIRRAADDVIIGKGKGEDGGRVKMEGGDDVVGRGKRFGRRG